MSVRETRLKVSDSVRDEQKNDDIIQLFDFYDNALIGNKKMICIDEKDYSEIQNMKTRNDFYRYCLGEYIKC
jgi:hypothetical protein